MKFPGSLKKTDISESGKGATAFSAEQSSKWKLSKHTMLKLKCREKESKPGDIGGKVRRCEHLDCHSDELLLTGRCTVYGAEDQPVNKTEKNTGNCWISK